GRYASADARASMREPNFRKLPRLDDPAFRMLFAKTAIKRIGRDRFVRNVLIAIGNSSSPALAQEAERLLRDASPLVRGAAVWALARLAPQRLAAAAEGRARDVPEVEDEWDAASTIRTRSQP